METCIYSRTDKECLENHVSSTALSPLDESMLWANQNPLDK